MKIRFLIVLTFIASLVAVSCNEVQPDVVSGGQAVVTVKLDNATKATVEDTADEAKVSSIQIFVFNADAIDGYKAATAPEIAALSVSVDATAGDRDVWAFINAPSLSQMNSKREVMAAVSHFADNAADKFVMAGHSEQTIAAQSTVTFGVDRYAARVRLHKVTRRFTNAALQDVRFEVVRTYLTSVAANVNYDFSEPSQYEWVSKSFGTNDVPGALARNNALVFQELSTPASVSQNASWTPSSPVSLYAYPNSHAVDDRGEGAVAKSRMDQTYRRTRLCVDCRIDVDGNGTFSDDEVFTYPVSMGALQYNRSYEITELILTRLGNRNGNDDDIQGVAFDVVVSVADWTQVLVGEGGVFTI